MTPKSDTFENQAEFCRRNGWGVGTRLVGDEGYGPDTIEITALGESKILAKWERKDGSFYETNTTLSCRDWEEVEK